MFRSSTAILTGAAILALFTSGVAPAHAADPPGVEPADVRAPRPVSFRLADGVRVTGDLTSWDGEGIDGSFGRRRWRDLDVDDVWRLHRRLLDEEDLDAWLALGALLLDLDGGEGHAERAFAHVRRQDPARKQQIDEARVEVARLQRERQRLRQSLEAERLATRTPEAADWPVTPWTPLDPAAMEAALLDVHEQAKGMLAEAGIRVVPIEAEHFVVYSDLDREAAAKWARQLDLLYDDTTLLLGVPRGAELFHGKAAVLMLSEREAFRLIEAQAFGYLVQLGVDGVCHFRGGDVFVNVWHGGDDRKFAATLFREAVHGIMHRYRSPRRLPPWANEGLAIMLAEPRLPPPVPPTTDRDAALAFIRSGGDTPTLFTMPYTDPVWPGRDDLGSTVGALIVELMIRERPTAFVHWIDAIKRGKDWMIALEQDYGVKPAELMAVVQRYYTVND